MDKCLNKLSPVSPVLNPILLNYDCGHAFKIKVINYYKYIVLSHHNTIKLSFNMVQFLSKVILIRYQNQFKFLNFKYQCKY